MAAGRPTSAYEMVFLLTKKGQYFYDSEAVRQDPKTDKWPGIGPQHGTVRDRNEKYVDMRVNAGANLRNVWPIPTQGRPDAHYASFPDRLPELCILAGTSERGVCAQCGNPWVRVVEDSKAWVHQKDTLSDVRDDDARGGKQTASWSSNTSGVTADRQTVGWQPTCECGADTVPATVLDCFVGRGTTSIVAQRLGRRSIGLDLNLDYLALARRNLEATNLPLGI